MKYKVLSKQVFSVDNYSLVPIRMEDRFNIMKWRNEQIYLLRQTETLTEEGQDLYFRNVVNKLFDEEKPNQILFSFLKGNDCIGYGGLVHINWIDRNAEISFLNKPELNQGNSYLLSFNFFLEMIEEVSKSLSLHKIYTYGFDISEERFKPLISRGYEFEARLKEHVIVNNSLIDVRIYSKFIE